MYNKQFYISSLIAGHVRNELSELEEQKLQNWINESENNRELFVVLTNEAMLQAKLQKYAMGNADGVWNKTLALINVESSQQKKGKTFKLWPRIAVAVAAVAAIAFGTWFYTYHINTPPHPPELVLGSQDIIPGKQGATLTLASGKKIRLTDAVNGQLAEEAGIEISKSANGQLVYKIKEDHTESNKINTLSTSNGETYIVTLPDNSKIWLNAASSLTYSACLNEHGKRMVKLEGEAYFEIAKDKKHPFIVESKGQQVEVLGTHFNVNAYGDEPTVATTLLEGSVNVTEGANKRTIKPGEQALNNGKSIQVNKANIENIVDWKNGDFNLDGLEFKAAMRKIARWYDVEVVYDASITDDIETGGWISRNNKLKDVLKLIEKSGFVHFKIEGRKIYVSK